MKLAQLLDVIVQFGVVKVKQEYLSVLLLVRLHDVVVEHLRVVTALDRQHVTFHCVQPGRFPAPDLQTVLVGDLDKGLSDVILGFEHHRLGAHLQPSNQRRLERRRRRLGLRLLVIRLEQQVHGKVLKVNLAGLEQQQRESTMKKPNSL